MPRSESTFQSTLRITVMPPFCAAVAIEASPMQTIPQYDLQVEVPIFNVAHLASVAVNGNVACMNAAPIGAVDAQPAGMMTTAAASIANVFFIIQLLGSCLKLYSLRQIAVNVMPTRITCPGAGPRSAVHAGASTTRHYPDTTAQSSACPAQMSARDASPAPP